MCTNYLDQDHICKKSEERGTHFLRLPKILAYFCWKLCQNSLENNDMCGFLYLLQVWLRHVGYLRLASMVRNKAGSAHTNHWGTATLQA